MVKFPYYSKYYDSRLSCMDMNYRLDRLVNQSVGSRLFSNKFYGHLENNGFVAYKNSVYSNMTLVKIVGNYSEVDKNTKLKLQFMLSEYVLVLYFIVIFSLFFIFFLILFEPIYLWLKFMPLVMIIISYILIIVPFNYISKDAEIIIEQLLELEM
ncbi:hypothetical protein C8N25_1652 [Algoriphagus antarcticus]|uniref:Uncharacterized protein n=2 Tax=Algoriphagus antarcticus TaxID=238540 RepID=A0A3E0CZY0_9BACT|nr:hypothetical protein [Algoriphagus antarcticus]REG74761.1 hypothetical protein C8N25_1652 [Algoriphagus antarcticus]